MPLEYLIQGTGNLVFGPSPWRQLPVEEGVFKRDPRNPVGDWNMIFVPYCTGDIHAGVNTDVEVKDVPGKQQFVGYTNFGLFLKSFGPAFASAKTILLTGSSAGGFGTLLNFDRTQECKEEAEAAIESESLGVPVHRRVYNLLRSDPDLWEAGPNKLGKLLGMSSRRLRRRLVSEGKRLSGLIEDARLDRARYFLVETDVAIKSIAERLGYSEPSAFHCAFKRWTGQTPARYKRDQRAIALAS